MAAYQYLLLVSLSRGPEQGPQVPGMAGTERSQGLHKAAEINSLFCPRASGEIDSAISSVLRKKKSGVRGSYWSRLELTVETQESACGLWLHPADS